MNENTVNVLFSMVKYVKTFIPKSTKYKMHNKK